MANSWVKKGSAGSVWLRGLKKRQVSLCLREPAATSVTGYTEPAATSVTGYTEPAATSVTGYTGFNSENVQRFF